MDFGGFVKKRDPIIGLREAVDDLTKSVKSDYVQDGIKLTRTAAPLIDQLHRAITNSLGAGSGAGKLARERTPLDVAAFTLYESIDGRVRSWCQDANMPARETVADSLRGWFPVWTAKQLEDALIDRHTSIITGWVTQITDMLEPPTKQEVTRPCPICGAMWATTGKGEETESTRAIWAVWRADPEQSYGICKACNKVWSGVGEMKSLNAAQDVIEMAACTVAAEGAGIPESYLRAVLNMMQEPHRDVRGWSQMDRGERATFVLAEIHELEAKETA